ncbi:MAG TPA: hypothetical protein VMN38_02220 [Sphingomicrobium sp.]|nr:hypothetical protein [Sphingomicrobium sp.]
MWSKRGQISEQLSNISDQIGEWTENMSSRELETVGGDRSFTGSTGSGASGDFDNVPSAGTGRATTSTSRSTGNKRRGATSGGTTGSGTMTGGSLDTGPSGRDSA